MTQVTRRAVLAAGAAGLAGCAVPADAGPGDEPEMVLIPAGPFLMGTPPGTAERLARAGDYHPTWLGGETPQREIHLPAYRIMKAPVTNARFAAFCRATGYAPRAHWRGPVPPDEIGDHPVVSVNLADALAFAKWAGMRLPTEAEWEKAARGPEGRLYPWGDRFAADACCWNRRSVNGRPGTDPVTAHAQGASPYGVMDMVGNAAEWCADGPGPGAAFIKGGCWLTRDPINLRPAARNMSGFANNPMDFYGFRCVQEVR